MRKQHLIKSGFWVMTGKGAGALVGLAINVVLARLLTPEAFGSYFLFFSVVAIAAVVAQSGLGQASVRLIAESMAANQPARAKAAVRLILLWGLAGAILTAVIIESGVGHWIATEIAHAPMLADVIWISAPFIILAAVQGLLVEIMRGYHRIGLATVYGEFGTSAITALLFIALWMVSVSVELDTILYLSLAASVIGVVFAVAAVLRQASYHDEHDGHPSALLGSRQVYKIAFPLYVVNLTAFIPAQLDIWVVGAFRPAMEVAQYAAAFRLAVLMLVPLTIVSAVMAPTIARMHAQGRLAEIGPALRGGATLAGTLALAVLVVFLAAGDKVLGLIYGDYYREGWLVLAILASGYAVNVLAGSCVMVLAMSGYQKQLMQITLVTGLGGLVLSLMLVQFIGATGVALGTAAGVIGRNIAALYVVEQKLGVRTFMQPSAFRHWRQLAAWNRETAASKAVGQ